MRNFVTLDTVNQVCNALDAAMRGRAIVRTQYRVEAFRGGKRLWVDEFHNTVVTAGLNKLLDATLKTGLTSPAWMIGLCGATQADGAVTTGTAAFTSAAGAFAAGDVTHDILVAGAGAAGVDLKTTVSAVGGATALTLGTNAGTTVAAARYLIEARLADTMGSHAPWTEVVAYSQANRVAWTPGTIAAGSVDNTASPAVFSINANNTPVLGAFMVDQNTKGGTSGTLYGMGVFSAVRLLQSGDTLNVTATPSVADA